MNRVISTAVERTLFIACIQFQHPADSEVYSIKAGMVLTIEPGTNAPNIPYGMCGVLIVPVFDVSCRSVHTTDS